MALTASQTATIRVVIDRESHRQGPLLPLLHGVQQELGFIPPEAVPEIARALHLSRAEVHGVLSFYHQFRSRPAGRTIVQICRAEACQARGSRQLELHAKNSLGLDYGDTSSDGAVTLEPVYCLGNCASGPSVRVDDKVFARVDSERFDELLAGIARQGELAE